MQTNTRTRGAWGLAAGCAFAVAAIAGRSSADAPTDIVHKAAYTGEVTGTALERVDESAPIEEVVPESDAFEPLAQLNAGVQESDNKVSDDPIDTGEPEVVIESHPHHLFQSKVQSHEDVRIELSDGSVVELIGNLAGFGSPNLDETFLLILGNVGEIWIEGHGTYACRVLEAPDRFIEKLPFRECRMEKLIADGRVILTEDRSVYEIASSSQSVMLEMEEGTPLWIAADKFVMDLGQVEVEALEVERHW